MRKQLAVTFSIMTILLVGPTFAIDSLNHPPIFGSATNTNIAPATANKVGTQTDAVSIFDTCLQDDSNGNSLQFNSTTGDYIFATSGPNGFTLGGRANLTIRGSVITLQQNGPDRRVLAKIDNSVHKGTAAVQVFSLGRTLTIMDRNTADSVCPPPQQSGVITPNGGTISIPGLTTITFPAGAFPFDTFVNVSITQSAETQEDFSITTEIFSAGSRLPFEVRINSGNVASSTAFQVTVQIPNSFLSQLPTNAELQAFAQIFEDGGEETLDSFELFPSSFDAVTRKIQVTLPAGAFTNRRTANETFEAIIVIGTTPTKSLTGLIHANENISQGEVVQSIAPNQSLAGQDTCEGTSLAPPLRGSLRVTSRFNPPSHYGTDYAASTGDEVLAVADGKIFKIGFQSKDEPNPRCPGKPRGWGNYVILEHADGSHTLYAHLEMATASEGQPVTTGTVIGKADNTGGSCGSHLHFEYAPRGDILQNGNKVNPEPCVGPLAPTIVVSSLSIASISISGSTLAFTDFALGALYRVSTNGGAVTTLATGLTRPTAVVNDGTNIYWTEDSYSTTGAIKKIPVGGGMVTTLASGIVQLASYNLMSDGTSLYFISYGANNVYSIRKILQTGGAITDLASGSNGTSQSFTINGGIVYYSDAGGFIKRVSTAGGTVTTMTTGGFIFAKGLLVSGTTLYWTVAQGGGIFSIAASDVSTAPTTLVGSVIGGETLATDGTSLYVANGFGFPGGPSVLRYNLSNFGSVTTFGAAGALEVALDGQSVYWIDSFGVQVLKSPK